MLSPSLPGRRRWWSWHKRRHKGIQSPALSTLHAMGMDRAKFFMKAGCFHCPGGTRFGKFGRAWGRAPVRRRTRRFVHAALAPCSVFAPRRTTRRQCRGFLDFQRAADREKRGGAPPWCRSAPRSGRSGLYPSCPPPGAAGASRRARQRLRLPKMGTHSKNHRLE